MDRDHPVMAFDLQRPSLGTVVRQGLLFCHALGGIISCGVRLDDAQSRP